MRDEQLQPTTEVGDTSSSESLRAATITGLRWASASRALMELMLLSSMVVLARLIPPAAFGPYAVAVIVQELAMGIQEQGVGSALVQREIVRREHLQAGGALAMLSGVILGALVYLAAVVVVEPIFGAPTASLIELSAPLCVVYAIGIVPSATLRRRLAFKRLSAIDILNTSVRLSVSIGLAAVGMGARSLVLGSLAAALAASFAAWISAPPPLPIPRRGAVRDILGYGVAASLASISWVCFRNCDYVIVGARLGTTSAGLYYRAYNLAVEYQKKISSVMGTVAFPVLTRTATAEELSALRCRMVRLLTLVCFPMITLLAIVAPVLIPWLLGPDWAPAVVPTQILALGGAVTLVIDTAGIVLMASGRSQAMLGFGVGHFVGYAALVWIVSPYGIDAVAIAAAVIHTVFLFISYAVMLHRSEEGTLPRLWTDTAPATVACVALAAITVPLSFGLSAAHTPALIQLVLVGLAAAPAYLLALRFIFPDAWRELWSSLGHLVPLGRFARIRRPSLAEARSVG